MQILLALGAMMACLGVALGAFGAHALKDKFTTPRFAAIWETAVQYQMYHAIGLLILGILSSDVLLGTSSMLSWAGYLMFAGIIFFSGSLYILAVTGVKKLGAITPIGGVLFIVAWVLVAFSAFV
ncbi:membrane protein [Lysinibacillus contaminans]|uniref:Membrane protein n=1 Tax=Lysinibacillus contaminans TaxID=1293441 RepID=A0ABR5K0U5_9BACI|nr:DUF423 domain-containing protein [Lysinibacillus contaminans]KOS68527.1 membrane protein [Lysinibacillus contaminans]